MRSFAYPVLFVCACLVLGCGWPEAAFATSLNVAPTRVELTPAARSGSIVLENTGAVATTIQVETFAWTRGNSVEALEPTRGLLAVPAVFNLPAGERQVIRVATRETATSEVETAYRLLITEVPVEAPETAAGIRFALRLSLPVFITPLRAKAEPSWSLRRGAGGRTLEVRNNGNAHLHVRRLTIHDKASGRLLAEIEQPSYVLAKGAHSWPNLLPTMTGPVVVDVQTNLGGLSLDLEG
jgi:fimbrial chaperone protein